MSQCRKKQFVITLQHTAVDAWYQVIYYNKELESIILFPMWEMTLMKTCGRDFKVKFSTDSQHKQDKKHMMIITVNWTWHMNTIHRNGTCTVENRKQK